MDSCYVSIIYSIYVHDSSFYESILFIHIFISIYLSIYAIYSSIYPSIHHHTGRPLRVRIIQTLETKTALDILYSLTDLLAFYQETFFKIVPIENAVHSAVKGCLIESKRLFLTTLNRQGEYLTQSPVVYPIDLKASHVTRECAIQIKEMLRVVSNSLSSITLEASDSCHIDTVLGRSFLYHRYNIIYLFIIVVIIIFITSIIISTIIVIFIINPISSIIIIIVVNDIYCILLKASLSSRYYSHVVSELNPYSLQKCLSSCLIMCLCCR
jgi:hypothetical protein